MSDFWSEENSWKEDMESGISIGEYKAYVEAQAAYNMGEIELWLEYNRPKSLTDWMEWEAEHGPISEFKKRWE